MSDKRPVTEFDLRSPEFKHPSIKPEDYEFRADGRIVRKDRWEQFVHGVADLFGCSRDFELDLLAFSLEKLVERAKKAGIEPDYFDELPQ